MYTLNGPAAAVALGVMAFAVLLLFLFSFRDTTQGFREFFDIAVLRNFLRSALRFRPRFSLKAFVVITALLVPLIVFYEYVNYGLPGPTAIAVEALYLIAVVAPIVYWFFVEAFGPSPRHRWKDYLTRWKSKKGRRSISIHRIDAIDQHRYEPRQK